MYYNGLMRKLKFKSTRMQGFGEKCSKKKNIWLELWADQGESSASDCALVLVQYCDRGGCYCNNEIRQGHTVSSWVVKLSARILSSR